MVVCCRFVAIEQSESGLLFGHVFQYTHDANTNTCDECVGGGELTKERTIQGHCLNVHSPLIVENNKGGPQCCLLVL